MTPPKKRITREQLEELEATALANVVAKIAAGGVPTARESALLRKAADLTPAEPGAELVAGPPPELEVADRPWDTRARRQLIDLEPQVESILRDGGPDGDRLALEFCTSKGAPIGHAKGLIASIKARWTAVMDDPERSKTQAAVYQARLEAAWSWAAHKPLRDPESGALIRTAEGVALAEPDLNAVPKILKLIASFHGLDQPAKVAHLHGHMQLPPAAALSPADRAAEIERLLAKHRAALAAGKAPEQPTSPPPSAEASEGLDS